MIKEVIAEKVNEAIKKAVQHMPYKWAYWNEGDDEPQSLKAFFENTWQGDRTEEVFAAASAVATKATFDAIDAAGFVVVPKEPTEAMLHLSEGWAGKSASKSVRLAIYKAMVSVEEEK